MDIVKDLVTKYDVDGIHMDDYFYPSLDKSESMNDNAEYEKYGKAKFDNIADFRRDNVNQVVKGLHDVIQATRDRKSTRLNSSHANISYAVFCLKKKKQSRNTKTHIN